MVQLIFVVDLSNHVFTTRKRSSDNDLFSVETKLKYVLPVFEVCSSSPEHRVTRAERKTRLRGSDDGNRNGILSADHKCR